MRRTATSIALACLVAVAGAIANDASCATPWPDKHGADDALQSCLSFAQPASSPRPFSLLIGMPTVPRIRLEDGEAHYLLETLASLSEEIDNATLVLVVSLHKPELAHEAFAQAKSTYANDARFMFCTLPSPDARPDLNAAVSFRVHQQTMDVVSTMQLATAMMRALDVERFLFMEDDFVVCPQSWTLLRRGIAHADGAYEWSAMRVSFGLCGWLLASPSRVLEWSAYLHSQASLRPPDHLSVEFFAKETERAREVLGSATLVVLESNIMEHVGQASTLRPRRDERRYLQCGDALGPPVLFEAEAYDAQACKGAVACAPRRASR